MVRLKERAGPQMQAELDGVLKDIQRGQYPIEP